MDTVWLDRALIEWIVTFGFIIGMIYMVVRVLDRIEVSLSSVGHIEKLLHEIRDDLADIETLLKQICNDINSPN